MKFRRKSQPEPDAPAEETSEAPEDSTPGSGLPIDAEEIADLSEWVDLGSLLVALHEGRELRLQVSEDSQQVQSALLVGPDGALELRPFSAPRNGELWEEIRPQVAADVARRGGTATEQQGPFGTELLCRQAVTDEEGRAGQRPSRIMGINGSRWMLMVTALGRPAVEPDDADDWHDLSGVAVRRGEAAMPPGDLLPLVLPDEARRNAPDAN